MSVMLLLDRIPFLASLFRVFLHPIFVEIGELLFIECSAFMSTCYRVGGLVVPPLLVFSLFF